MPIVVIDPGHGGRDPGAVANGLQEKVITLQAAQFLRDALRRSGFSVIMTRETDTLPLPGGTITQDLAYRTRIANDANADLYVSWHADSATGAEVNGAAVWIHPVTRGTQTDAWAQRIIDAISASTGQRNRGVYLADFQVLRDTEMDAVLIEAGFLTNPQEAANLSNASFARRQAEGAAQAICAIFGVPYVSPVTPQPSPQPTMPPQPSTPLPSQPIVVSQPEQIPVWAEEAIHRMIETGIMTGYPDGTWRPDEPVTRAQLATALLRFYNYIRNGNGGV